MNERKGFTLVELLAVIVILAIIMIIAIPSVLGTMTTARKKSFCEYVTKVYMATQNKYMAGVTMGDANAGSSFRVISGDDDGDDRTVLGYIITEDLGLENTGNYRGVSLVVKPTTDDPTTYFAIALYDDNYALIGQADAFYIYFKEPNPDTDLTDVDDFYKTMAEDYITVAKTNKLVNIKEFNEAHGF